MSRVAAKLFHVRLRRIHWKIAKNKQNWFFCFHHAHIYWFSCTCWPNSCMLWKGVKSGGLDKTHFRLALKRQLTMNVLLVLEEPSYMLFLNRQSIHVPKISRNVCFKVKIWFMVLQPERMNSHCIINNGAAKLQVFLSRKFKEYLVNFGDTAYQSLAVDLQYFIHAGMYFVYH